MNSLKFLLKISFTAILAFLLQKVFPWWSIGVASFLISFIISTKGVSSFFSGFLGIAILWFILAAFIDIQTNSILSSRIANLFYLPNTTMLIVLTAFIGGLFAGFAALAGSNLRSLIMPQSD